MGEVTHFARGHQCLLQADTMGLGLAGVSVQISPTSGWTGRAHPLLGYWLITQHRWRRVEKTCVLRGSTVFLGAQSTHFPKRFPHDGGRWGSTTSLQAGTFLLESLGPMSWTSWQLSWCPLDSFPGSRPESWELWKSSHSIREWVFSSQDCLHPPLQF